MRTDELTQPAIEELVKDPKAVLDRALKKLKIVVDAQPGVAGGTFFEALINYRDRRTFVVGNNLLPQNEIAEFDGVFQMYTTG